MQVQRLFVEACHASWTALNPEYQIRLLNEQTLHEFLTPKDAGGVKSGGERKETLIVKGFKLKICADMRDPKNIVHGCILHLVQDLPRTFEFLTVQHKSDAIRCLAKWRCDGLMTRLALGLSKDLRCS